MPVEVLITYMDLFKQGKNTVSKRKEMLLEQREVLMKKQEEIRKTLEKLDYKIGLYNEIEAGKRKDFMEED